MAAVQAVKDTVREYLSGQYEVQAVNDIPSVEQVAFGKKAKKLRVCALAIDLRNSTELLVAHQGETAGKIHKAFLFAAASTVEHYGGRIRSFKGDGLLALWPAQYQHQISTCVRAAMTMKWLLDVELVPYFEPYGKIDFGIGVDWGDVVVVRTGLGRNDNHNDLVFLGRCINFAVAMSEQARGPSHIHISDSTYANLRDPVKQGTHEGTPTDMWHPATVRWKGKDQPTRATHWYCPQFGSAVTD